MGIWSNYTPCPTCKSNFGIMLKCSECGTVGCSRCLGGGEGKGQCKICKKICTRKKV